MPSRPAAAARAHLAGSRGGPQVTHRESHAIVERLGAALSTAGFPPMPSRVFAALLVDEDGRMTSAEAHRGGCR